MIKSNVDVRIDGHIGRIIFSNGSHNALPQALLIELADSIRMTGENEQLKLIVLSSGGDKTFCAGADFNELVSLESYEDAKEFFLGFAKVIYAIKSCPIPVVSRVHGRAIGGAVGLIAASDYVVANHFATCKLSELSIGIGPFVIAPVIQDKIGEAAFNKMLFEPMHWHTAEWATAAGLYTHSVRGTEQQGEYINYFVEHYSGYDRASIIENKKLSLTKAPDEYWRLMEQNADLTAKLVLSDYTQNKLKSFLKK